MLDLVLPYAVWLVAGLALIGLLEVLGKGAPR